MMKAGRPLEDVYSEVMRQAQSRVDYIARPKQMTLCSEREGSNLILNVRNGGGVKEEVALAVKERAHDLLGQYLDIPAKYYDRLRREHPKMLDCNVNTLLESFPEKDENGNVNKRMIRALDDSARAVLSDRYRRLDNYELMNAILPEIISRRDELEVVSCEVTDQRLYIKIVSDRLIGEVKVNDPIRMGVLIQNSEIGLGRLNVLPYTERLKCLNGMTVTEFGRRKNHAGRRIEDEGDGEAFQVYSNEAIKADNIAFFLKTRDLVRATLDETILNKVLNKMKEAAGMRIEQPLDDCVEVVSNKFHFNEWEREQVFRNLIEGKSITLWGLANAITRTSTDCDNYDRATEMERFGGDLLALPPHDMRAVLEGDALHRRRRQKQEAA